MRIVLIFLFISLQSWGQVVINAPIKGSGGGITLPLYLEIECGTVGASWTTGTANTGTSPEDYASGPSNEYVEIPDGTGNDTSTPSSPAAADIVEISFDVDTTGIYTMAIRASSQADSGNNSFWLQVNEGSWFQFGIVSNTDHYRWQYDPDFEPTISLTAGTNTIRFHNREDGARLDKIEIGESGNSVTSLSEEFLGTATNCP